MLQVQPERVGSVVRFRGGPEFGKDVSLRNQHVGIQQVPGELKERTNGRVVLLRIGYESADSVACPDLVH